MNLLTKLRKNKTQRDAHGQPLEKAFRSEAVIDRQIDELLGIVKGVISDGIVTENEAIFLLDWLKNNRQASKLWPAKVIYPRLCRVLDDDVLDDKEAEEVLDLLNQVVGGTASFEGEQSLSTSLPLTQPPPEIVFPGKLFCFTGKFLSGNRKWCQTQAVERGGLISKSIVQTLDYLVIGEIGSRDWVHSTHGRKIEKAIKYRDADEDISIVGEQHWVEFLT